jgi:hypothetical protein
MDDVYKEIICSEAKKLTREQRIDVLGIVKRHDTSKAKRFPDGTRINLNQLPSEVILRMYNYVRYKLKLHTIEK